MYIRSLLASCAILLFFSLGFAEPPIVLQNGLEGFSGCDDTYLVTANFYEDSLEENHADHEFLNVCC